MTKKEKEALMATENESATTVETEVTNAETTATEAIETGIEGVTAEETPIIDPVAEATAIVEEASAEVVIPVAPVVAEKKATEKPPKVEAPKVIFISALYGQDADPADPKTKDYKRIEVADKMKVGRKLTNKLTGVDPIFKVIKDIKIRASYQGVEKDFFFRENEYIDITPANFPAPAPTEAPVAEATATEAIAETVTAEEVTA